MAPILASTRGVGVGAWRSAYAPTHADANISQYERSHVEARMLTYAPAHMALKSETVGRSKVKQRLGDTTVRHLSLGLQGAALWRISLMPRRMMPAPRCPRRPGSEAFRPHGGQQHRVERRGDGRRASRGQVSQPRPAREEDLTEEAAPSLSSASAPRGPP